MYPIAIMPDWLKAVAHVNPLTYEVDAIRVLMIRAARLHMVSARILPCCFFAWRRSR